MGGPERSGWIRLLGASVAGGALVAAAAGTGAVPTGSAPPADDPAAVVPAGTEDYLGDAVLVCPGRTPGENQEPGAALRLAAAPVELFEDTPPGRAGAVRLELAENHSAQHGESLDSPGSTLEAGLADGEWAAVRATGALAPGITGAQLDLTSDPGRRGLLLSACTRPSDVVHLVGGGSGAGRVEHIVVANPSGNPVTVDLEIYGEDGQVETVGGTDVVVPTRGRVVQRLDALAPGVGSPVVRVVARGGPVSAHLVDQHRDGTTDLGMELVAEAAAPAHDLVVPAVPGLSAPAEPDGQQNGTGDGREVALRLFAPEGAAVVELRALTAQGATTPDPAVVRVPAGSTVELTLAGLPDGASALRLRSDAPVTGGALVEVGPSADEPVVMGEEATATAGTGQSLVEQDEPVRHPAGELAWVAAVPVASTPSGIALPQPPGSTGLPGPDRLSEPALRLAVSAIDATTARVLWLGLDEGVRVQELSLPNDTTELLGVPDDAVAVWVLPTGEPGVASSLHVSAQDAVGPYLAAATLPSVPWTHHVPALVPLLP